MGTCANQRDYEKGLGFMLANDEPGPLVQLIKGDDLRTIYISAEQLERTVLLLIHAVIANKLLKTTDHQERFGHVVVRLFSGWATNFICE